MEIKYDRGLVIRQDNYRIMLDPEIRRTPVNLQTLVTHAHSDHTAAIPGSSPTHLNQITLDLYNATDKSKARYTELKTNYEPFELGPFEIEFINSGHLLGAVQMVIRKGDETFLYTGDYCPEDLMTVNGADSPKENVDVVAIDATYGSDKVHFQSRNSSRTGILSWVVNELKAEKLPVMNIAKLGGAQEIIKYVNKMVPNLPILVSDEIYKVCSVYEKHGINLEYEKLSSKKDIKEKAIVLVPRPTKSVDKLIPISHLSRVTRCIVTGQSAKFSFSKFDHAIPLSTHASMNEVLSTLQNLNPSHVLTNFGYHKELAEYITNDSKITCDAQSVKEIDEIACNAYKHNHALKTDLYEFFD